MIQGNPELASPTQGPGQTKQGPETEEQVPITSGMAGVTGAGYSLWEYDGTSWLLKEDRSRSGYRPSGVPTIRGRFRGQLRAIASVPVRKGESK